MRSIGYLFKEGIRSLWNNRTMSIASIAVLISCLLLTGTAVLLTLNMQSTMKSIEGNNNITVFLKDSLPQLRSIQVGEELRTLENISSCTYVAKDEALADVMEMMLQKDIYRYVSRIDASNISSLKFDYRGTLVIDLGKNEELARKFDMLVA